MLHAAFGADWTETDEKAYLDLLGDQYALARYQRLRRWSPFDGSPLTHIDNEHLTGYTNAPARHLIAVANTTDHPIALTLSASYALNARWHSWHNREESRSES